MKFLSILTLATFLPLISHAQDQNAEIAQLKSELKASQAEAQAYKKTLDDVARSFKNILVSGLSLEDVPGYIAQLIEKIRAQDDKLFELSAENENVKEQNEALIDEKQKIDASLKKIANGIAKTLKTEGPVDLETTPGIIAELADKNNQLHHQTDEMQAEIKSLEAQIKQLKSE